MRVSQRMNPGDEAIKRLAHLWRQAVPDEPLAAEVLAEKLLEDPAVDPSLWVAAWQDQELVGAAVGVLRPVPGAMRPAGHIQFLAVAPGSRRRGVATQLLDELERRLWEKGAGSIRPFGAAPSYLWPGIDVHYTPAWCLFERRGYQLRSIEFNMAVDLTRPLPAGADGASRLAGMDATGTVVRRMEASDREALADWLERTWGPNWAFEGLLALRRSPPSGFVAWQQDRIVGFAVYDSTRPGWFGPMGVEPGLQGSGVGVELSACCLKAMAAQGYTRAEIAWAGPRCFYARKLGAVISRVWARMELPSPA